MSEVNLTDEEKRIITNKRQAAVRYAWKNEKQYVLQGEGTRDWSIEEQKEMLERGSVSGYEGHHMKSVDTYPEEADNPYNIQFLDEEEHLYGAHQGDYHNQTNGYYDPETGKMHEFEGKELEPVPVVPLSESYKERQNEVRNDYTGKDITTKPQASTGRSKYVDSHDNESSSRTDRSSQGKGAEQSSEQEM